MGVFAFGLIGWTLVAQSEPSDAGARAIENLRKDGAQVSDKLILPALLGEAAAASAKRGYRVIIGDRWHGGRDGLRALRDLPRLSELQITHKDLCEKWCAELVPLTTLHSLYLQGPHVDDACLERLRALHRLAGLWLVETAITDRGLAVLGHMRSIRYLSLAVADVTDDGMGALAGLGSLEVLYLEGTLTTTAVVSKLGTLTHLRRLRLNMGGKPPADQMPKGFSAIARLHRLELLYARDAGLTDEALAYVAGLDKLEELRISANHISSRGLAALANLKALRVLELKSCDIDNAGVSAISRLPNLQELDIGFTQVDDRAIATLCQMKRLKRLFVLGSKLTPAGIDKLRWARPELYVND